MKVFRALLLVAAAVLQSGCFSHPPPSGLSTEARSNKHGLVIISAGAKETCASGATALVIYPKGQSTGRALSGMTPNNAYLKSPFPEHPAHVYAMPLAPGAYSIVYDSYIAGAKPILPRGAPTSFEFDVLPNETVYAGELYFDGGCHYKTVAIKDEFERDVGYLEKTNPKLDRRHIARRLVQPKRDVSP